jgi:hypothetical protein
MFLSHKTILVGPKKTLSSMNTEKKIYIQKYDIFKLCQFGVFLAFSTIFLKKTSITVFFFNIYLESIGRDELSKKKNTTICALQAEIRTLKSAYKRMVHALEN